MATYTIEGRYAFGKWNWLVLKHADHQKPEMVGSPVEVEQAREVVVERIEAERRGEE